MNIDKVAEALADEINDKALDRYYGGDAYSAIRAEALIAKRLRAELAVDNAVVLDPAQGMRVVGTARVRKVKV